MGPVRACAGRVRISGVISKGNVGIAALQSAVDLRPSINRPISIVVTSAVWCFPLVPEREQTGRAICLFEVRVMEITAPINDADHNLCPGKQDPRRPPD